MMRSLRKKNLEYNRAAGKAPEFAKPINGQAVGAVSGFRYGLCRMSFNGCEVIAVHNALVYLGMPKKLEDIAFYMERYRMLMGFFGCAPFGVGRALKHFGADVKKVRSTAEHEAFIMTYWTKIPFLSSLHTVFCRRTSLGIEVFNCYNSCTEVCVYRDVSDFAGKYRPIAVYSIRRQIKIQK